MRWIAGLMILVCGCALVGTKPIRGPEVQSTSAGLRILEGLRDADAAILKGAAIEARVLEARGRLPKLDSERILKTSRVTEYEGAWASRSVTDESVAPPKYPDPASTRFLGGNRDSDVQHVWRDSKVVSLYEPDFRGHHVTLFLYEVTADGVVTELRPTAPLVFLDKPGYQFEDPEVYIPVLSAGRGFSYLLDTIDEVSESEKGLIHCKGRGRYATGTPSEWEIWIDPSAAYTVRKARCTNLSRGYVLAEFENWGLRTYEKGCLPERARFTFDPANYAERADGSWEIEFTQLDTQPDQEIIDEARVLLRGEYPDGTEVFDERGDTGQVLRYTVGEKTAAPGTALRMSGVVSSMVQLRMPEQE